MCSMESAVFSGYFRLFSLELLRWLFVAITVSPVSPGVKSKLGMLSETSNKTMKISFLFSLFLWMRTAHCVFVCLSVCLSASVSLQYVFLSVSLSIYPSLRPSLPPSIHPSIPPSLYPSIHHLIHLSIHPWASIPKANDAFPLFQISSLFSEYITVLDKISNFFQCMFHPPKFLMTFLFIDSEFLIPPLFSKKTLHFSIHKFPEMDGWMDGWKFRKS